MKRLYIILLFCSFITAFSQTGNRFQEEEAKSGQNAVQAEPYKNETPQAGPGNPGDPVPVDQYVPFLLLLGAGIMVYTAYRKKQIS